jgi:XTP/dITP diphosphohydrolase
MSATRFDEFVAITKRLRTECPWDREQTHASIRQHLIEEAYEVVESIEKEQWDELRKELGDLLLHVVFHANIAEERSEFTLDDVIRGISEKMVFRHPHVFGTATVDGAAHVAQNWEKLKLQEGRSSVLEGVPKEMPALLRAQRVQEKASKVGFDWNHRDDAWKKVEEETKELHEALEHGSASQAESEMGDLLFAIVNYARFVQINPEHALRRTIEKFTRRFQHVERRLKEEGKDIHATSLEEMDALWNEAKRSETP